MDGGKSRAVNEPFGKATTLDLVSVMEMELGGGVQLTESDVYASEFCRRCSGVLNDEEEEWGLSQAWGRSGKEGRRGRMSGLVSYTSAHVCQ